MAIERKDRSFDRIFSEVTLEKVPLSYVEKIMITTIDGNIITIDGSEVQSMTSESDIFSAIGSDDIADIAIALDYDSIKADISKEVNIVLGTLFDEE